MAEFRVTNTDGAMGDTFGCTNPQVSPAYPYRTASIGVQNISWQPDVIRLEKA